MASTSTRLDERDGRSRERPGTDDAGDLDERLVAAVGALRGPVTDLVVHAVEATARLVEHATRDGLRIAATAQREAFGVARAALALYGSLLGVPRERGGDEAHRPD